MAIWDVGIRGSFLITFAISLANEGALLKRDPTRYPEAGWTMLAEPPKAKRGWSL